MGRSRRLARPSLLLLARRVAVAGRALWPVPQSWPISFVTGEFSGVGRLDFCRTAHGPTWSEHVGCDKISTCHLTAPTGNHLGVCLGHSSGLDKKMSFFFNAAPPRQPTPPSLQAGHQTTHQASLHPPASPVDLPAVMNEDIRRVSADWDEVSPSGALNRTPSSERQLKAKGHSGVATVTESALAVQPPVLLDERRGGVLTSEQKQCLGRAAILHTAGLELAAGTVTDKDFSATPWSGRSCFVLLLPEE